MSTKITKKRFKEILRHLIRKEIEEASNMLFKQISSGKVKIEIYKKYKLEEVIQAHKDLESRKIIGPAVIIP